MSRRSAGRGVSIIKPCAAGQSLPQVGLADVRSPTLTRFVAEQNS
ncbi:MAG: hypothetical protein ABI242_07190 [Caulobacteraceae bacterium]